MGRGLGIIRPKVGRSCPRHSPFFDEVCKSCLIELSIRASNDVEINRNSLICRHTVWLWHVWRHAICFGYGGGDLDAERSAIIVLVTTSTQEEAEKIGRMLIEAKLAACANVVSGIRSIFRWDNNISVENECLMLIKTTRQRFAELEAAVRQQHSYSVPEIVALPVVAGSETYLNWVRSETDK